MKNIKCPLCESYNSKEIILTSINPDGELGIIINICIDCHILYLDTQTILAMFGGSYGYKRVRREPDD